MKSESTVRPALVERYPSLVRINYGVVEEEREFEDDKMLFFVYQMVELEHTNMDIESLMNILINDRYPLEVQVKILTGNDAQSIKELNNWRHLCKCVAREVLGIHPTLEDIKEDLIAEIDNYDTSEEVNCFYYHGVPMWLDKSTRVGLMNSTSIEKSSGAETTTLWLGSITVTLPVDDLLKMLSALELYALDCYNVTAKHKADAHALQTIEEALEYDFTTGYPPKLRF